MIAGTDRARTLHASGRLVGESLHLVGSERVSLSEFGVKPPTLLLGAIKVKDTIMVRFDLTAHLKR